MTARRAVAAAVARPKCPTWRRRLVGCLVAVVAGAAGPPAWAQTSASSQSPPHDAGRVQVPVPAPPPASLKRIRRALALDRNDQTRAALLDFREDILLRDERPRTTPLPYLGVVAGVDQFSHMRPPVPGALPGHWDMVAAMTPREVTQAGSADVMGIATAAVFSAAAFTLVPSAIKTIGGWFASGRSGTTRTHPVLSHGEASLALAGVTTSDAVLDADIDQRGRTVALSLTVTADTPPAAARALGERFVRLVKTLAATEPTPGDDLGSGNFDYVVHISTPTNARLARGGKCTTDRAMNW